MKDSTLRALIVDDDANCRERLWFLLASHADVEVVGEANSAANALILCRDLHPNLLLLDVDMPGGDGFSLLEKLEPVPAVIFVTGFDQFAIRAFEVNAVDYLLKPVVPLRLTAALRRIVHAPSATQTGPYLITDRIFLPSDNRNRIVFIPDIIGIEAADNYTDVLVSDGTKVFMRRAISNWESCLPKSLFFCPHRSLIVNLQAVSDVVLESRNELKFRLNGHDKIFTLGRDAGARLRRALRQARGL